MASGTPNQNLGGRKVLNVRRETIGKIDELFIHGDHDAPNWALVKVGILGIRKALVPLYDAQEVDRDAGGDLWIPYETDHVAAAPEVNPEDGRISDEDAELLHGHYGLQHVIDPSDRIDDDDLNLRREMRDAKPPGMDEDSPLTKRRRKRAAELGVPGYTDGERDRSDDRGDSSSNPGSGPGSGE